jgi:hypothetical protein
LVKLGTDAAWSTAVWSAVRFALEDELPEGAAELLGDVAELLEDVAEPCGVELELLDDEHAASSIAAPIAVTPKATRDARGVCLPSPKPLMRPRICHTGSDKT